MTAKFPVRFSLTLLQPASQETDADGNEYPGGIERLTIPVVQWAVDPVTELVGDSVLRTVSELTVCVPECISVDAAAVFELPDGSHWQVQGHENDYAHGFHGWNPGVKEYRARRVTG